MELEKSFDAESVYQNKEARNWWKIKTEQERRLLVREYFKEANSEGIDTLYGIMSEEMEEMYLKQMKLLSYAVHKTDTVKTDIELPIYIYTQGELLDEEFHKWDGEKKITVSRGWNELAISISTTPPNIYPSTLERNLVTEEIFNEVFKEALEQINPIETGSE